QHDILYVNSFFSLWFSILPQILARLRLLKANAVCVAPRGELDAGALAIKAKRKRIFISIFRLLGFSRRLIWHASTPLEASSVARAFPGAKVLIKENETLLSPRETVSRDHTWPLKLLYLGRVSPKKRLHLLIEALY